MKRANKRKFSFSFPFRAKDDNGEATAAAAAANKQAAALLSASIERTLFSSSALHHPPARKSFAFSCRELDPSDRSCLANKTVLPPLPLLVE